MYQANPKVACFHLYTLDFNGYSNRGQQGSHILDETKLLPFVFAHDNSSEKTGVREQSPARG